MFLPLITGIVIGTVLGLLGAGGAILAVPTLVYVFNLNPKTAIPSSLLVIGVAAFVGFLSRTRQTRIEIRTILPFSILSMVGTYTGTQLSNYLSGGMQMLMLSVIMLFASYFMWKPFAAAKLSAEFALRTQIILGSAGFSVGVLTGLLGIGGGFMVVPALVFLLRFSMIQATLVSLLVISLNSTVGLFGYWSHTRFPWELLLPFVAATVLGILIGTKLSLKLSNTLLRKAFAVTLVLVSVWILYSQLSRNGILF